MTCYTMTAAPTKCVVHRDQHQIRKRLLNRLGFTGPTTTGGGAPSITRGTVQSTPRLSSRQQQQQECSTSTSSMECRPQSPGSQERHVRFSPEVSVREIPSHRDYDDDTRRRIWMGTREIDVNAQRNRMEYLADGCNYQKVTEEKNMMKWNGELVHPATYWIRYEEEQDRLLQEELMGLPSSSSSASSGLGGLSLKKSPTMSSLVGMAA